MANTYTQIFMHVVFAVQGRQNLIQADFRDEVQKYMTGIVTNLGSKLIAINNRPDHFHLLTGYKPHVALSELIGKVKYDGLLLFLEISRAYRPQYTDRERLTALLTNFRKTLHLKQ